MERFKLGLVFWVLLLVSVTLPVSAQKQVKKQLYGTNLSNGGCGVGTTSILVSQTPPEYLVRTHALPGHAVTKVTLLKDDLTWGGEIVLCENGGAAGDCTYNESDDYDGHGNLDLEGVIVGQMFPTGPGGVPLVTGAQFLPALQGGHLMIRLNDGEAGSGVYVRIM